jgi:hypothetical protein
MAWIPEYRETYTAEEAELAARAISRLQALLRLYEHVMTTFARTDPETARAGGFSYGGETVNGKPGVGAVNVYNTRNVVDGVVDTTLAAEYLVDTRDRGELVILLSELMESKQAAHLQTWYGKLEDVKQLQDYAAEQDPDSQGLRTYRGEPELKVRVNPPTERAEIVPLIEEDEDE